MFQSKIRNAIDNPQFILNYIFGVLKYFPASLIENDEVRDMPIYCISLKGETSRRKFMAKQVAKNGFTNFNFVDAIEASKLKIDDLVANGIYDDILARKYHHRPLNLGEIACSLSHGKVYEIIVENKHPIALILEDDALFITKLLNNLDVSKFPADWDAVFLSSFYTSTPPKGNICDGIYNTDSWEGSCAGYLVSDKGALKLARSYKPVFHAADGFVGRCMELPEGYEHTFKQQGAVTSIGAYLVYPDPVLNGSSVGFWNTSLPMSFR